MAPTRNSNIISLTLKYVDFDMVSSSTKELGSHSHLFGTVTDHALPRLAAALNPCYLNCCLLNSDTFLFHVYLRMMSLMPLTLFALADCC